MKKRVQQLAEFFAYVCKREGCRVLDDDGLVLRKVGFSGPVVFACAWRPPIGQWEKFTFMECDAERDMSAVASEMHDAIVESILRGAAGLVEGEGSLL